MNNFKAGLSLALSVLAVTGLSVTSAHAQNGSLNGTYINFGAGTGTADTAAVTAINGNGWGEPATLPSVVAVLADPPSANETNFVATQAGLASGWGGGNDTLANFLGSSGGSGFSNTPNFNGNDFLIDLKGFINAPSAGPYNYTVAADDQIAVFLNGSKTTCIDFTSNGGVTTGVSPATGTITLPKGSTPIEILYYQGFGGDNATLAITGATFSTTK